MKNTCAEATRTIYGFMIGLWIFIIAVFQIFPGANFIENVILLLPFFFFIIAICSAAYITENAEKFVFRGNILTLGLIISVPLLNFILDRYNGNKHQFIEISMTGIILSLLALIDVWLPDEHLCFAKHYKSGFETMAIILLIYVIYHYFVSNKTLLRY